MVQVTDYPWSGNVAITINPAVQKKFSVRIRVPDRDVSDLYTCTPGSDGINSISVNGSAITPAIENGYAVITRDWKAGDKIELVLPMKIQRVKAGDKIDADIGKVALRYGPLIYNVEQVDQDINQVLNPETALNTKWDSELLGGVMVIKGKWAEGIALTAIPNYARANRIFENDESTTSDSERQRRRGRPISSIVWIKDQ
jgi:DUF1680 family protein